MLKEMFGGSPSKTTGFLVYHNCWYNIRDLAEHNGASRATLYKSFWKLLVEARMMGKLKMRLSKLF